MRTWDDWSDFEINKKVAEINGELIQVPDGFQSEIIGDVEHYYCLMRVLWACHGDYCNNPSNMWPIILDNNIEISPLYRGEWCASPIDKYTFEEDPIYNLQSVHKNPLRAAAIAFLMMNGVNPD